MIPLPLAIDPFWGVAVVAVMPVAGGLIGQAFGRKRRPRLTVDESRVARLEADLAETKTALEAERAEHRETVRRLDITITQLDEARDQIDELRRDRQDSDDYERALLKHIADELPPPPPARPRRSA